MPSRNVCLYGTEEAAAVARRLIAGPVTAEFENGALRHIKYRGIEVLRGIAFLVRNVNWGTYTPDITDLEVGDAGGGFHVTYRARCSDDNQAFTYVATVTGTPEGTLSFEVEGAPETDFATNRLGFVVLHPLVGVAGENLTVTHTDGTKKETTFPHLVSPSQPVFDIRVLSHQVCAGVTAACTMEGDAYEMEDQRNWTDASYKTYVRPLSKPYPYTVAADEVVRQSVKLAFACVATSAAGDAGEAAVTVTVGSATENRLPRIGLALEAEFAAEALAVADGVKAIGPQLFVCQLDMRAPDGDALGACGRIAEGTGASIMLELIVPDDADPTPAVAAAAGLVRDAGLSLESVAISPAAYLKSYQPDAVWPDVPPLDTYYGAVRAAFPGTPVGGGMFSYFTELNRKRPPAESLDYVTYTTCPIVHDADDRSVMETLEALPYLIASTRAFVGDKPYRVGPSTIGMRQNPYGVAPADNPSNGRVPMARTDPRQWGLFAAAWALGYAAEMARGGIEVLTLAAPTGPFGVFDDRQGVYPLYHVVRGLAGAAGQSIRDVEISDRTQVQALAHETADGMELWLANLWPEAKEIVLDGVIGAMAVRTLDLAAFETATSDPAGFWFGGIELEKPQVWLDAYAVACISVK